MGSFWDRRFGKGPPRPGAQQAVNDGDEDLLTELREQVRRDVAAGFEEGANIVEIAVAAFEDKADPAFLDKCPPSPRSTGPGKCGPASLQDAPAHWISIAARLSSSRGRKEPGP